MRMNREAVSQTDREAYDDLLGAGLYFTSEGAAENDGDSEEAGRPGNHSFRWRSEENGVIGVSMKLRCFQAVVTVPRHR